MALKKTITITVTPTITAGAYSANDNVGGLLKFKSADLTKELSAVIKGICIGDAAAQEASTDLVFFSSNPSASTFTNNGAQAIADADLPKIIHVENVTAYDSFSDNSVATVASIDTFIPHTDAIYVALVTRGTPTYVATSDLDITLVLEVTD
jgi:hypothetical protein